MTLISGYPLAIIESKKLALEENLWLRGLAKDPLPCFPRFVSIFCMVFLRYRVLKQGFTGRKRSFNGVS
jgi:hypothetical protein